MRPGRIVAIVIGALLALPGIALLVGGGIFAAAADEIDEDGYIDLTLDRLESDTAVVVTQDADLRADPGPPDWLVEWFDASVRLQVAGVGETGVFVGIGPADDVAAYVGGIAHDEISDVEFDGDIDLDRVAGSGDLAPPGDQSFWVESASGTGDIELVWDVEEGEWTAVLANDDGSPGIVAYVTAGLRVEALAALAVVLLTIGVLMVALAAVVIGTAVRGHVVERGAAAPAAAPAAPGPEPVRLEARLEEPLSPWLWLVKWILAIPHFVVLVFLWVALVLMTVVAWVAVLFTGTYPRSVFDFNVGVLRWSWRVSYYAATGGLGTDRYPPFTLERADDYPATLDIAYPGRLSRGLVVVRWLLAVPHYIVLAILVGGWWLWGGGLLTFLVLFAVVALLFTGIYPRSLFDLILGLNRWVFRVLAYTALMTDRYPPFRLDQGGAEPEA